MALLVVLAVGLVIGVFAFSRESLTSVGARFMSALGRGDIETLTDLTLQGKRSREEIREAWKFAVEKAGRYYNFRYRIVSGEQADANTGAVRMQVLRNLENPAAYEENFQLPMVKVGDEWKVDVWNISRELYPGLPR